MSHGNGIASAEDFKTAAAQTAFGEPERVVLPKCGFAVLLCRPRAAWFALERYGLPAQSVAFPEAGGNAGGDTRATEAFDAAADPEFRRRAEFWFRTFHRMFHAPKLALDPTPDEISPAWIPDEDQAFLVKWAMGLVASGGSDAATFRARSGRSADGGPDGADVREAPERDSADFDGAVPV